MSKTCSSCNSENVDEAKFCRKCGSSISQTIKDDIILEDEPLKQVDKIESEWDKKYAKLQQEVREERKVKEAENKDKVKVPNKHTDNHSDSSVYKYKSKNETSTSGLLIIVLLFLILIIVLNVVD